VRLGLRRVAALVRAGDFPRARRLCARICLERPESSTAHNNLGVIQEALGDFGAAAACYGAAVALAPTDDRLHFNLGNVQIRLGDLDSAEAAFSRALDLNPQAVDALNNLGIIRQYQRRGDAAVCCFRAAIAIDPLFPVAPTNLANLAREERRFPAAISAYRDVIRQFPGYGPAHLGLGVLYLQLGDYEHGWPEYEWRFWSERIEPRRSSPGRDWDGSNLRGRTILVRAEQAIGDQIMFASILPELLRDAGHVIVECDRRLVPIFARSFPAAEVVAYPYRAWRKRPRSSWPEVRAWMGTLPVFYRRRADMFPHHHGFLVAAPALVAKWKRRMRSLGTRLKVGISWSGGSEPYSAALRSIPLTDWSSLLATPGVAFVNLQYGPAKSDARDVGSARVYDWADADPVRDLENFAAEIAALDLVVSIDNSTVHMAGALSQRVWAMVPYSATWRWPPGKADNLWFPSVRVFEQPDPGDWDAVLRVVKTELVKLASTHPTTRPQRSE
jgi:tetratricopeptide (TPR) repeat protein